MDSEISCKISNSLKMNLDYVKFQYEISFQDYQSNQVVLNRMWKDDPLVKSRTANSLSKDLELLGYADAEEISKSILKAFANLRPALQAKVESVKKLAKLPNKKNIKELSELEREEATIFLSNPQIMSCIEELFEKRAIKAGKRCTIAFLNGLSTKLKRRDHEPPNHTRYRGPSSSGKTYEISVALSLFPSEMKIVLGGASKMALKYGDPDYIDEDGIPVIDMNGRLLYFLEERGGEDAYHLLYPILSGDQNEVVYATVGRNEEDHNSLLKVKFKGQPSYFTSTVEGGGEEIASRTFTLTPDISEEHTKLIIQKRTRRESAPTSTENNVSQREIDTIQNAIRILKSYEVFIPYAEIIVFSNYEKIRLRRDINKILTLIKSSALIHQNQRQKIIISDQEFIIATFGDYKMATDLFNSELSHLASGLPRNIIKFYEQVKADFFSGILDFDNSKVTAKQAAETTGYAQTTCSIYLKELADAGYLTYEAEGREYVYFPMVNEPKAVLNEITLEKIQEAKAGNQKYLEKHATCLGEMERHNLIENLYAEFYKFIKDSGQSNA